jgi:HlyD family secretion protein
MMKRILIMLVAAALVALDVYVYLQAQQSPPTAVAADLSPVVQGTGRRSTDIVAIGLVVPMRHAVLGTPIVGRVADVLVDEGDLVVQNQLLVQLDNHEQQTAVAGAQAGLQAAQAQLDKLKAGAREQEITIADAAVRIAQANLTKLEEGMPNPAVSAIVQSVAKTTAEEELRRAQAQLDLIQASPRPEDVAIAEAAVAEAEATLQQKQLELAATEIRAPFAGTVAVVDVELGQQLELFQPIIQIADLTNWRIESDQLDEWSVVNIKIGDPVEISFDALGDVTVTGTLVHVRPVGNLDNDNVTYSVVVQPDWYDPRIRWNMTTQMVFHAQR